MKWLVVSSTTVSLLICWPKIDLIYFAIFCDLIKLSNRFFQSSETTHPEIFWSFQNFLKNSDVTPSSNDIYSRFWYAFSLFLRKFHSAKPFNNNFCEPGRARFAEKDMEFPSQVVSKTYSILFSAKFGPFSNPFRGRARWTCWMYLFMSWLV